MHLLRKVTLRFATQIAWSVIYTTTNDLSMIPEWNGHLAPVVRRAYSSDLGDALWMEKYNILCCGYLATCCACHENEKWHSNITRCCSRNSEASQLNFFWAVQGSIPMVYFILMLFGNGKLKLHVISTQCSFPGLLEQPVLDPLGPVTLC